MPDLFGTPVPMSTPLLDRPSALPGECRAPLVDLIVALADNKHALGIRYAEWCSSGPTIEAGVAATAMAQDELGHARVLYGLLEELPGAPRRSEHEWSAADARTVRFVEAPFQSWPHLIVANLMVDRSLAMVLETALESRYLPLRHRARKIIEEERYHAIHGQSWVAQLAVEGADVRARLAEAVESVWDETLCWFGPPDGGALRPLVDAGVLAGAGDPVRTRFAAEVGPALAAAGVPAPVHGAGARWELARPLPWNAWNEPARRIR
ncbi:MAG TPA: Phenylacetic acid catabolic protein [bacterium]|nr:Phenylacetic acid catabolic protein [bacterium]